MYQSFILPLASPDASLSRAGGKGMNLSLLLRAGYPVPGGFIVTTDAYRAYVEANDLRYFILATIAGFAYGKVFERSRTVLSSTLFHCMVDWTKHFFF